MIARIAFLLLVSISLLSSTVNVSAIHPARAGLAAFQAQNVKFLELTSGLNQPLLITNANDGSGRLFILQRAGQILIYKNGALLSTPFLNIQPIVNSSGSEQGLLALAFHPNYETNGRFYTLHTDQSRSIVLSVFTRSSTDPDQANPNSRVPLLTIAKSYANHNGGTLAFGPDGYLYWSTGDGGSAGDPDNNAQNLSSLLGKILRLDVSSASSYSIPAGNPFYNNPNPSIRKEIWAYGLRNPWRFSFDRLTNDIYIGDVGQSKREEIDFRSASSTGGENYGWRVMEGSLCYNPSTGCNQSGKVLPVAEYDHTLSCSITGGHVYRGTQFPQMYGYYFYGDFCSGLIYTLRNDPQNGWISVLAADTSFSISSFGEDEQGELYLADYAAGKIYRVVYELPPGEATLVSPNGSITTNDPTYIWNKVLEATWYYLYVSGPSNYVFTKWYRAVDVCPGSTCSVSSATPGLAGGSYRWWIQTWNNSGGYGPWSTGMDFSVPTSAPPGRATPVSPGGSIGTSNPIYTWSKVSDATWYYLYVSGPSGYVFTKWYRAVDVCGASDCSVANATSGLASGLHRWWVQTWNNAGGYGPWSAGMDFNLTPPTVATLTSPNGNTGTNNPTYTWNEVSAAAWYYLYISGPAGYVFADWYAASDICSSGTCSVANATPNLGSGSYRWWVQTWNSAGYGPWSTGMNFSVP